MDAMQYGACMLQIGGGGLTPGLWGPVVEKTARPGNILEALPGAAWLWEGFLISLCQFLNL